MNLITWIKSKPYSKGIIVGFFLGIFWVISGFVGSYVCNRFPVQSPSVHAGLCRNIIVQVLFYSLFLFAFILYTFGLSILFGWIPFMFVYYILIPLILIVTATIIGGFIHWLIVRFGNFTKH